MTPSEDGQNTFSGLNTSRRAWLAGLGCTALSAALAGCPDGSGESDSTDTGFDDGQSTSSETEHRTDRNRTMRLYAEPGEVQDMIDEWAAEDTHGYNNRSQVTLYPSAVYTGDDETLPIHVRRGVTLDLNGADIEVRSDTDVFHLHSEAHLKNGRVKYLDAGDSFSSTIFTIDTGAMGGHAGLGNHIRVQNVDTKGANNNDGVVMHLDGRGGQIGALQVDGCVWNSPGRRALLVENDNPDSWVNGNYWTNLNVIGGDTLLEFRSGDPDASVNGNYFSGLVQPQRGESEWLAELHGGSVDHNRFDVMAWDLHGYTEGIVHLHGNATNNVFSNTMSVDIPNEDWIDNRKWVDETGNENGWIDGLHGRVY